MATSEGIPSSIDIEFLELNDNPYIIILWNLNLISKDIFDRVRNPHLFDSIANVDCECRLCNLRLRLWL